MAKLSFMDKINILINTTKDSKYILLALLTILLITFIVIRKRRKPFMAKKTFIFIYIFICASLLVIYHSSLYKMFDYLMNNIFIAFYFPNLAIYALALIVTNIILWVSIFSTKIHKFIKTLNYFIFCIIHYILFLLLNIINLEQLDIYTKESIYTNTNALGLIELSSLIFLFLIIYKLFLTYIKKSSKKKRYVLKQPKKLPKNIIETNVPKVVKEVKKEYNLAPSNLKVEQPKTITEANKNNLNDTKEFEKLLTVDDYKYLLKLLISQKAKEETESKEETEVKEEIKVQAENKEVANQQILPTKTIIEEEPINIAPIEEKKKEQSIFEELQALYNINE